MRTASIVALALSLASAASAQSLKLTPSFALSEVYDGNLYATPRNETQSFVQRFGPRLELDARELPFSVAGRYALDVDYVTARTDQGFQLSRQLGALRLGYRPMERLTIDAEGYYLDTRTLIALTATPLPALSAGTALAPRLSTLTALDRGRLHARRIAAGPTVDYRFDRRTRGDLAYSYTRDALLGLHTDAHVASAAVSYRFTRVDTGSTTLLVRKFLFGESSIAASAVVLLGWSHRFDRRTVAALRVGPRFRNMEADGVEGDASLRHGFGHVELEATYARAETVTLGLPGSREIDEAALNATVRIKPALFRASTGIARTHGSGVRADLQYAQLSAATLVEPWLTVELSLSLSWQELAFRTVTSVPTANTIGGGDVFHDIVALSFVVAPPKPLEW